MEKTSAIKNAKPRYMVCFVLRKEAFEKDFERDAFEDNIIFKYLPLQPEDVYCLQSFLGKNIFDLSLSSPDPCVKVWSILTARRQEEPFVNFLLEPLFARELRPLWVHMFSPYDMFMFKDDIVNFLKRFLDVQDTGVKILDRKKIWNRKRKYMVRFRADPKAEDRLLHHPVSFTIGVKRGYLYYLYYLYYPEQHFECRRYGQRGHYASDCKVQVCRKCDEVGHSALTCRSEPKCNLCGGSGHLYKLLLSPAAYLQQARPRLVT
ncbi:ZCHC3 protein, partial [Atractosteus spatula]|nr:ZCHC3 protein [Atractosteus spatula]